jgi:hypothetical protein
MKIPKFDLSHKTRRFTPYPASPRQLVDVTHFLCLVQRRLRRRKEGGRFIVIDAMLVGIVTARSTRSYHDGVMNRDLPKYSNMAQCHPPTAKGVEVLVLNPSPPKLKQCQVAAAPQARLQRTDNQDQREPSAVPANVEITGKPGMNGTRIADEARLGKQLYRTTAFAVHTHRFPYRLSQWSVCLPNEPFF